MSTITIKEGSLKKAKKYLSAAACRTMNWCSENKEVIIAIAPSMIGFTIELIKMGAKKGYLNEEKRLKNNYIYDRDHGHFYELRRKPTNKEWIAIDQAKDLQAPLSVVLSELGLLRK